MSIKARRKNLRMHNLDEGDIQGNPELLVRAVQQEGLAPSNPSTGKLQTAICLFPFKIKDSSPNVPPRQPVLRDAAADQSSATSARRVERSTKWRLACHAMIVDLDSDAQSQVSGLEHSSHCIPDPFAKSGISKTEFIMSAKKYPVYVGGYLDPATNQPEESLAFPEPLRVGTSIAVVDNDVQGGVYGTIVALLETSNTDTQFRAGPIRSINFGGGAPVDTRSSTALSRNSDNTSVDLEDIDPALKDAFLEIKRLALGPDAYEDYGIPASACSNLQIVSAWRSAALQDALKEDELTPASAQQSLHCVVNSDGEPASKAIDFLPIGSDGRSYQRALGQEEKFLPVFLGIGKIIEEHFPDLKWGGRWVGSEGAPGEYQGHWNTAVAAAIAKETVPAGTTMGWDPVHIDIGPVTEADKANLVAAGYIAPGSEPTEQDQ